MTRSVDAIAEQYVEDVAALDPVQATYAGIAGHDHVAADPITPTAQAILDALTNDAQ